MLHPRTFVFVVLAGAFGVLAATMATNYALDPQYVFGTPLSRHDENANYRYHRVRQYQAQRERVDGLLFASSRGRAFDPALVAQKMGVNTVAKFDVTAGMITDHLPALEYVLRDKASRGEKIRAVLLLIDVDSFGKLPSTNVNIDSFLPPELSGEHPARFWWRYLTVFQFRMWRGIIAYRMRGADRAAAEPSQIDRRRLAVAGFRPPASIAPVEHVLPAADDCSGRQTSRCHAAEPRRAPRSGGTLCRVVPRQRHRADRCNHADARRRRPALRSGRPSRCRATAKRGGSRMGFCRTIPAIGGRRLLGRPIAFQARRS